MSLDGKSINYALRHNLISFFNKYYSNMQRDAHDNYQLFTPLIVLINMPPLFSSYTIYNRTWKMCVFFNVLTKQRRLYIS